MLKLENVKKLYSNNRGLRNTTIDFQEGEITGILGRNGSGKTTLLKGILNFCLWMMESLHGMINP